MRSLIILKYTRFATRIYWRKTLITLKHKKCVIKLLEYAMAAVPCS